MKKILRFTHILFILFFSFLGNAQESPIDSTHLLKEVNITATRSEKFMPGTKYEKFDSTSFKTYSSRNVADLLSNESQIFIKSYSAGGLAVPSLRGTSANHTAILWNGFNLQSPMNGLLDLSLVANDIINNVSVQLGGASAMWGSGAIGGAIHLNNVPQFDKGLSLGTNFTAGSFNDMQEGVKIEYSNKKFISSTRFFNRQAENNFPFNNIALAGKPLQELAHAQLKQYGLIHENYWKIKDDQLLSLRFWHQNNDRNLPPYMTQSASISNQKDIFYRTSLEWQKNKEKYSLKLRSAYFDEQLIYTGEAVTQNSNAHSGTFITEAEVDRKIATRHTIHFGINNTYAKAYTKEYQFTHYQNRISFFGSYLIHNLKNTWNTSVNARQELIIGGQKPFTLSAGFEGQIVKGLKIKGKASRNYRVPTFNDLYWVPGGNDSLVPESGWSEEAGLSYQYEKKHFTGYAEATLFNSNVNGWIIWLPNQNNIWSPKNLQTVWSRGVEYNLNLRFIIKAVQIKLSGKYQFAFSTNEKTEKPNDISLHKQLIYVPAEKAQAQIGLMYKGISLSFIYNYSGYRYTSADNLQYLYPYHIGNINLDKTFYLKNIELNIFARINNIWNEQYQIITYSATPLRNYAAGISITYIKPNKTK